MASKSKAKAKPASKKPAKAKAPPKIAAKPPVLFDRVKPPKPTRTIIAGHKPAKAAAKPKAKRSAKSDFGSIKGKPEIASPLPPHPLAEIFPLIVGREFEEMTASIRENGLRDEICVFEGMVLDGRNRQNACIAAGVACRYVLLPADIDPLKYVLDKNLHRRQLNDIQRASVAAKIANLGHGGDRSKSPDGALSAEQAADALNVARRQVTRARVVHEHGGEDVREALDRGDIPVATAEKIARLPQDEQQAALEAAKPNGARSIMSSRQEPDDSLDFFPTPPWATRALMERVFPHLGYDSTGGMWTWRAWEPACGEGHMAEVLSEYFDRVHATDIRAYGYAHHGVDFLDVPDSGWDWIITNPPFGDKTEQFVLHAIEHAQVGVAMFVRLQWLETIGRYERLFRDKPPTLIAFFCERVNLCKGRWEPEGATATAYIWLVWLKGEAPRAPFWIPPGCREGLTHADDAVRFTMHPVGGGSIMPSGGIGRAVPDEFADECIEAAAEITELQALETIEAGREIDIKLPIVTTLKGKKYARGSVKLKLTKLGMVQLEALRQEAYEAHDAPVVGIDGGAADGDQAQEEISQVDCRVCGIGSATGICAQCMAAADHTASIDEERGLATCSCGWLMDAFDTPEGDLPSAVKAHWQNVVTEANAAAASVADAEPHAPAADAALDIPENLRRGPDGLAPYQRSEAAE